jgi:hypothetical protein
LNERNTSSDVQILEAQAQRDIATANVEEAVPLEGNLRRKA